MLVSALIGLGNVAWKYDADAPGSPFALTQAGAMRIHPQVILAGGSSPNSEDRAGFTAWTGGAPAFADTEEMLRTLRPDIVGICSPTSEHFHHAHLCLDAGVRAIWLEKPPTETPEELEELIRLAERVNAVVCVNYFRRYLTHYQRLRECIATAAFGTCRLLHIMYSPGLARNGVHLLDQLFFLTDAEAYELLWVEHGAHTASPSFALRLSNGLPVQASGADLPYHTNDISAVFDGGTVSILRGGKRVVVERAGENDIFAGFYDLHDADNSAIGKGGLTGYMQNALIDIVECLTDDRPPLSTLRSSRLSQRLLQDILQEAGR